MRLHLWRHKWHLLCSAVIIYLYYKSFPGEHNLAQVREETGLNTQTASAMIKILGTVGLLEVTKHGAKAKGAFFSTRLHVPKVGHTEELLKNPDLKQRVLRYKWWLHTGKARKTKKPARMRRESQ